MTGDADLDLVRRAYAAFTSGDLSEFDQFLAPDVEQIVPGNHPLAGVFRGAENVVANLGATVAASEGTMTVTLEELFTNTDGQVIALDRTRASRNGSAIDHRAAILFTIADGRITRFSEFYANPAAMQEFWA
jgi:ketosteroid isomerase-like protein